MKWIYRILRLFFCPHYWVIVTEVKVYSICEPTKATLPIGLEQRCRCKRCGEIKVFKS